MRTPLFVLLVGLLVTVPGAWGARAPATASGGGVVLASSNLCAHMPVPAPLEIALYRPGSRVGPEPAVVAAWVVEVAAASPLGCPVGEAGTCPGTGTLGLGVSFGPCAPLGGQGTLGPVYVCQPGPARPPGDAAWGWGDVRLETALGSFDGRVKLLLTGAAVDEALGVCL